MSFCTNCGFKLDPSDVFCPNCGMRIETSSSPEVHQGTQPESQVSEPATAQTQVLMQQPEEPKSSPSPASSSKTPAISRLSQQVLPQSMPASSAPSPQQPQTPLPAEGGEQPKTSRRKLAIIITLVLALVLSVAAFVTYKMGIWGPTPSPTVEPVPEANEQKKVKPFSFNKDALDVIVDKYSSVTPGVSAVTAEGSAHYSSSNGTNGDYVASGLYLPVYLAGTDKGADNTRLSSMMSSMNNNDANALIGEIGGINALNQWLRSKGYEHTTFARNYGDVTASAAGRENYTSPDDSAKMLQAVTKISPNALPGISTLILPEGITAKGHTGKGIKNTYNYFLQLAIDGTTVDLAVMGTTDQQAIEQLGEELTAEISTQLSDYNKKNSPSSSDTKTSATPKHKKANTATTPVNLTQVYNSNFGERNALTFPVLTFSSPSNWSIKHHETTHEDEIMTVTNSHGAEVTYTYTMGRAPKIATGWTARLSKVSNAKFVPVVVQDSYFDDLGSFGVAKVVAQDSSYGTMYALIQDSRLNETTFPGDPKWALSTPWAGTISVIGKGTQGALSAQEEKEVIAIIASFHAQQ